MKLQGTYSGPIEQALEDDTIGVIGPFGLRTDDLHHFHDGEGESGDMDAMQAYCFAFRRAATASEVGLPRQTFRFYRNLDLDFSFQFKAQGYRIVADAGTSHKRSTSIVSGRNWRKAERDELSRKNYGRFLDRWGDRADLSGMQPSSKVESNTDRLNLAVEITTPYNIGVVSLRKVPLLKMNRGEQLT